jgi:hypothetical protein
MHEAGMEEADVVRVDMLLNVRWERGGGGADEGREGRASAPSRCRLSAIARWRSGEVRAGARRVLTSLRVVASGREVAKRLVQVVPPQQFEVSIQAAIGAKVVAKERIRGMKKDVLVKSGKTVGGGDVTRKLKLLEKQKRGKLKLKSVGSVVLNDEAFMAVLDRRGNL